VPFIRGVIANHSPSDQLSVLSFIVCVCLRTMRALWTCSLLAFGTFVLVSLQPPCACDAPKTSKRKPLKRSGQHNRLPNFQSASAARDNERHGSCISVSPIRQFHSPQRSGSLSSLLWRSESLRPSARKPNASVGWKFHDMFPCPAQHPLSPRQCSHDFRIAPQLHDVCNQLPLYSA
jgi:hypothetical protein